MPFDHRGKRADEQLDLFRAFFADDAPQLRRRVLRRARGRLRAQAGAAGGADLGRRRHRAGVPPRRPRRRRLPRRLPTARRGPAGVGPGRRARRRGRPRPGAALSIRLYLDPEGSMPAAKSIAGTPAAMVDTIGQWQAIGVDHILLDPVAPGGLAGPPGGDGALHARRRPAGLSRPEPLRRSAEGGGEAPSRWAANQARRRSNFAIPPIDSTICRKASLPSSSRRWRNAPPRSTPVGESGQEVVAPRRQAVGIGDDAQPPRRIERAAPAEPAGVLVGVDRDVHPGERGEVVDPATGRGEVEVEQPDGDPVAVDDVLRADVVVADHELGRVDERRRRGRPSRRSTSRRAGAT